MEHDAMKQPKGKAKREYSGGMENERRRYD